MLLKFIANIAQIYSQHCSSSTATNVILAKNCKLVNYAEGYELNQIIKSERYSEINVDRIIIHELYKENYTSNTSFKFPCHRQRHFPFHSRHRQSTLHHRYIHPCTYHLRRQHRHLLHHPYYCLFHQY